MSAAVNDAFLREMAACHDDLAAFVREDDQDRSLTVVREVGDPDLEGQARRWVRSLRKADADIDVCGAMQIIVDRHADGSREEQRAGIVAAIRFDERGHDGLAAALDALWSVRAKDPRDFWRMVESARRVVLRVPTPPREKGCSCPGSAEKLDKPPRAVSVDEFASEEESGESGEESGAGPEESGEDETSDDDEDEKYDARKFARAVEASVWALEVQEEARRLVAQRKRAGRPSITDGLIDVRSLDTIPSPEWLIRGLIPKAAMGFLAGKFGSYKSFAAVSLACSLAQGKAWQGRDEWAVAGPVKVLYVAAEGAAGIAQRIRAWERVHGEIPAGQLAVYPRPIRLNDPDEVAELAALVDERDYHFVVIDTYHRSAPGVEENSSTEFGEVFEAAARIRDEHDVTFLFVDHTGHAGSRTRGTSAKEDDADFSLLLDLSGDDRASSVQRTLTVRKLKDAPVDGSWPVRLVAVGSVGPDGSAYLEIGEVSAGARSAADFWRDADWWAADLRLPDKVAALRGNGSAVAIDIFRVLAGTDDPAGLTRAEIAGALAERPSGAPSKSSRLAAFALLAKHGITTQGESGARISLALAYAPAAPKGAE